jgi:hypothetical protein
MPEAAPPPQFPCVPRPRHETGSRRLQDETQGGGNMPERKNDSGWNASTETAAEVRERQHTGTHDKPAKERGGSDRLGGTRKGAGNVEPKRR